jgi:hypothetical protein
LTEIARDPDPDIGTVTAKVAAPHLLTWGSAPQAGSVSRYWLSWHAPCYGFQREVAAGHCEARICTSLPATLTRFCAGHGEYCDGMNHHHSSEIAMLKRAAFVFATMLILVFAQPRPFLAQSDCGAGQTCSVSIDVPSCVNAQVDFNLPPGTGQGYWTTDSGDTVSPDGDVCADDGGCDDTDYFNGAFDGGNTVVVRYTLEWTGQNGQAPLFYDGFCTDSSDGGH